MKRFDCPYLNADVELTEERRSHIQRQHPEFGDDLDSLLAAVLKTPDEVRRDTRYGATRLLSAYFHRFLNGKHMVVAVVSDAPVSPDAPPRH